MNKSPYRKKQSLNPLDSLKPNSNRQTDFYQFSVHLIYSIVIAQSFASAEKVLIPFGNIFSSFSNFVSGSELFLAYFVIVTGWIGYTRSISVKPHKDNAFGTLRFVFDLLILFAFFYLLDIATKKYFIDQFHLVLISIFILYAIWDYLKCKEYPERRNGKTSRAGKTVIFLLGFLAFGVAYTWIVTSQSDVIFSSKSSVEFTFIIIATIMTFIYRFWKWRVPAKSMPMTKKPKAKKASTDTSESES